MSGNRRVAAESASVERLEARMMRKQKKRLGGKFHSG